jgi:multisubunit Na+/H+ antiporter MnhE subunit
VRHAIAAAAALALIYVLTLASADPVDVAMGAVIAGVLVALLARRLRLQPGGDLPPMAERVLWFPLFLGAVLVDIAVGTWDMALRVLHLRRVEHPGLVRVPIGARSERGVAVSALATTLSPGTVLIDVDWENRHMLLHVIDAADPDDVRARLQRFYDRYQRRVFP